MISDLCIYELGVIIINNNYQEDILMNNEQITNDIPIDPILIERVNHLSGTHSALFWDVLYGTSESLIAVENTEAIEDL